MGANFSKPLTAKPPDLNILSQENSVEKVRPNTNLATPREFSIKSEDSSPISVPDFMRPQ